MSFFIKKNKFRIPLEIFLNTHFLAYLAIIFLIYFAKIYIFPMILKFVHYMKNINFI